ncbi:MAG: hypothetical protein KAU07_02735 [Candidatus Andersenbacteria bacterium]|nr:hypothetical protein [Candidatus Andersenbacteria bacterium]
MKINIKKSDLKENLYNFLRKCGYAPFHDSYVKVISGSGYPRFHIYVNESDSQYVLNLHLDQKRPSYGKETAHSGEYDGKVVEEEAERIEDLI